MTTFYGLPLEPQADASPVKKADLCETFTELAEAGFLAHPVSAKGNKSPLCLPGCAEGGGWGWGGVRDGTADPLAPDQFRQLVHKKTTDGVGIILQEGEAVVEVEGRARDLLPKIAEEAERLGASRLIEQVATGWAEESASGGLHFHIAFHGGANIAGAYARNANGELLGEVLGPGKFCVVSPSGGRTHSTGCKYRRLAGGPDTVPVLDEEELLIVRRVFSVIDEAGVPSFSTGGKRGEWRQLSQLERDFCRRVPWPRLLSPRGWKAVKSHQVTGLDGNQRERMLWRRPGKSDGASATTIGWTLYSFSDSVHDIPARQKLTKFDVYCRLWHDGDRKAAMDAAKRNGFGTNDEGAQKDA